MCATLDIHDTAHDDAAHHKPVDTTIVQLYLETLGFTADIVAPIFFIVFLGIVLKRVGIINEAFVHVASRLVFMVALPALVFISIVHTDFHAVFNPRQLGYVLVGTIATYVLIWWLASFWIDRAEDIGVFVQGSFRSNYGIIGLAVAFNLYGPAGLAEASLLLALVIPLYNVLSIIALTLPMHSGNRAQLGQAVIEILKNPLIMAVMLALPFSYFGYQLPQVVERTGEYFANLSLPLALLAIGGALNLQSLKDTSGAAFWATSTKLIWLPIVLTLGAWLYGFSEHDLVMLLVLFSCPTAAASYVMARAMGGNDALAANIVLTTTLGSVLTMSTAIYIVRLWGWV